MAVSPQPLQKYQRHNMYLAFKHLHSTLALISIIGFIARFALCFVNPKTLQKKWLKIAPHIIDTFLLLSAFALMFLLQQYPFVNHWLTAKVIALLAYIGFGLMTLKFAKANMQRVIFGLLAIASFGYIMATAITKNPAFLF